MSNPTSKHSASQQTKLSSTDPVDKSELARLERIVEKSFYDGAMALKEIRDKRLYRERFKTFEEYCQDKWGFTRQRARQLIEAGEIIDLLPADCQTICKENLSNSLTVSAVTQLAKAPETERPGIIKRIQSTQGKVTAAAVKEEVTKSKAPIKKVDKVLDKTGLEIPAETIELWQRGANDHLPKIQRIEIGAHEMRAYLILVKKNIQARQEGNDLLFREIDYTESLASLNHLILNVECAIPHAICWDCNGKRPKNCETCRGRGFVSEFFWNRCCPEEIKNLRKGKV